MKQHLEAEVWRGHIPSEFLFLSTLPKFNSSPLKNGWLEDHPFLLGPGIFSGFRTVKLLGISDVKRGVILLKRGWLLTSTQKQTLDKSQASKMTFMPRKNRAIRGSTAPCIAISCNINFIYFLLYAHIYIYKYVLHFLSAPPKNYLYRCPLFKANIAKGKK